MDGSLVDLGRDDSKSFTFYRSLSKEAEVKLRCKMRRPDAAVGTGQDLTNLLLPNQA